MFFFTVLLFIFSQKEVGYLFNNQSEGRITEMNSIKIGNQLWMKENLKTYTFSNGDSLKICKTKTDWIQANKGRVPAVFIVDDYDVVNDNLKIFLYNGYAVTDKRGLAPNGQRIPNDLDWKALLNHYKIKFCLDCTEEERSYLYQSHDSILLPDFLRNERKIYINCFGDTINAKEYNFWTSSIVFESTVWQDYFKGFNNLNDTLYNDYIIRKDTIFLRRLKVFFTDEFGSAINSYPLSHGGVVRCIE
jgi:uncharacterized protein (TIGR02145 family)